MSDFTNVFHRTFDRGKGIIRIGDWTISPFWAKLVVIDKYKFDKSTSDTKLFGIYSTGPLPFAPVNLDVYWLSADNSGVTINATSGRERRQTIGARTWGRIGQTHLDFQIEGAGQFGTVGRADVAAGMFTTKLGYNLQVPGLAPTSTPSSTMRAATASPAAGSAPSTNSSRAPTRSWGTSTTSDDRTSSALAPASA